MENNSRIIIGDNPLPKSVLDNTIIKWKLPTDTDIIIQTIIEEGVGGNENSEPIYFIP